MDANSLFQERLQKALDIILHGKRPIMMLHPEMSAKLKALFDPDMTIKTQYGGIPVYFSKHVPKDEILILDSDPFKIKSFLSNP